MVLKTLSCASQISPGILLWQVSNRWQREQNQALKELGITNGQFSLLAAIVILEGPGNFVTQSAVAKILDANQMMTSQMLRNLEDKGVIHRSAHIHDKRSIMISLSPIGRQLVADAIQIVQETDKKFFEERENEYEALCSILPKLTATKGKKPKIACNSCMCHSE